MTSVFASDPRAPCHTEKSRNLDEPRLERCEPEEVPDLDDSDHVQQRDRHARRSRSSHDPVLPDEHKFNARLSSATETVFTVLIRLLLVIESKFSAGPLSAVTLWPTTRKGNARFAEGSPAPNSVRTLSRVSTTNAANWSVTNETHFVEATQSVSSASICPESYSWEATNGKMELIVFSTSKTRIDVWNTT